MGVIVRQKVKGKGQPWWVFVSHNGKRKSKQVGDKKAAEAVASKIRTTLKIGEFDLEDEKSNPTFKEYADSWIKTTVPATCKVSTLRDYQDILRIHDMRHTYATLRISKWDNIADVSNQLGHHTPKLTMDIYYHWIPGKKKPEVDALDDPEFMNLSAPYTHPEPAD